MESARARCYHRPAYWAGIRTGWPCWRSSLAYRIGAVAVDGSGSLLCCLGNLVRLQSGFDLLGRELGEAVKGRERVPLRDNGHGTDISLPVGIVGKNVLVIGINYWPEPIGIAPYTTAMAEYLAEHGAHVSVITGVPHYPEWRVPKSYRRRMAIRERRHGVDILRVRHTVPRKMTALRRAAYEATFLTQAAIRGLRRRPDLVLASTPALGGALAAASVARRVNCPLTIVVQDLVALATTQSGIKGGGRLTAATARLEGAALRAAAAVAVVGEGFIPAVEAYGVAAERITVLPNWAHITPTRLTHDEARAKLGWAAAPFVAVYTGNMGLKQDLGNVVEAARLLAGSAVQTVLVGDGSQRVALEKQARELRNVSFTGLVDDELYPVVLAAADVLIVNERPSVGEMSLPSKLTSYLAAGRPILAAVSEGGASHRALVSTGGAAWTIAPGDPGIMATALTVLSKDAARRGAMSRAAVAYAGESLDRESSLRALVTILLRDDGRTNLDRLASSNE
jgi:colanic acid biosynthesis glycosyl transferase WcaI